MRKNKAEPAAPSPRRSWALWGIVSALLYASGARAARRTALRGIIATTVSAAVGWAIRKLWPNSPLDPSDDVAAAGAFAASSAIEMRSASVPVQLAAAVAGVSEIARGRRGPRELAGAALGTAAALASTRVWPVPPVDGPHAPTVSLPSYAEPSEDGAGLVIVVNKDSGDGESPADELRTTLPGAEIVEVQIEEGNEVSDALRDRAGEATALGVAGGDGTVNVAADIALEHEKVLMVVPAGTFNHLSAALCIETIEDAVDAVKKGQAVEIDVARIDGRTFLNTASFGGYVEFVDARERLEHRIGKWPAVIVALIRVLRSYEPVHVEIDGAPASVWMAFVGNCRYHPSGFAPTWRERFDDGLLDFRYVDGSSPWARTRLTLAVLTGRLGRCKVYHQSVVRSLRIKSSNGPLRLARDGETFEGSDEIVVEKLDDRLKVYALNEARP